MNIWARKIYRDKGIAPHVKADFDDCEGLQITPIYWKGDNYRIEATSTGVYLFLMERDATDGRVFLFPEEDVYKAVGMVVIWLTRIDEKDPLNVPYLLQVGWIEQ